MSLLDDARRLLSELIVEAVDGEDRRYTCAICRPVAWRELDRIEHETDCPVPTMPKIVAGLEAAESLLSETGPTAFAIPPRVLCRVCHSEGPDWTHTARCPWAALREALDA
jgi:hypothetical protein